MCIDTSAKNHIPHFLISTYMPCKGVNDYYEAFLDCLNQLNEILLKYGDTHDVVLGVISTKS